MGLRNFLDRHIGPPVRDYRGAVPGARWVRFLSPATRARIADSGVRDAARPAVTARGERRMLADMPRDVRMRTLEPRSGRPGRSR